jgi:hypothetical protein
MARPLLVASGGGGDAIAAAMLGSRLAEGEELHIATYSWDRLIVDPVPGPRSASDFVGLERVGEWNYKVTPTTTLRAPAASTLPRLAAELPATFYLLDPHSGVVGLEQQLRELVEITNADRVHVVDVGGDIVAAGDEPGLRSPLADSLTLASIQSLERTATVVVAGPGLDGELTAHEVRERCRLLAPNAFPSLLSVEEAITFGSIFEWHPSEASGMLRAAALRTRGSVEMRDHAALVLLTDQSPEVWQVDARRVFEASHAAQAMAQSTSLAEVEDALRRLGRRSEIDYERSKAGREPDGERQHDTQAAIGEHLADIETEAASRGADFLTIRRLAELLKLAPEAAPSLGPALRDRSVLQYFAPLWAVHRTAGLLLAPGVGRPISQKQEMNEHTEQIYVRLLNEGVEVWRPVQGRRAGIESFLIVGPRPQPEGERWEFPLDSLVSCRPRRFAAGEEGLAAEALAPL